MPAFLHFYPGFDYEAYKRLKVRVWRQLFDYMDAAHKASQGR